MLCGVIGSALSGWAGFTRSHPGIEHRPGSAPGSSCRMVAEEGGAGEGASHRGQGPGGGRPGRRSPPATGVSWECERRAQSTEHHKGGLLDSRNKLVGFSSSRQKQTANKETKNSTSDDLGALGVYCVPILPLAPPKNNRRTPGRGRRRHAPWAVWAVRAVEKNGGRREAMFSHSAPKNQKSSCVLTSSFCFYFLFLFCSLFDFLITSSGVSQQVGFQKVHRGCHKKKGRCAMRAPPPPPRFVFPSPLPSALDFFCSVLCFVYCVFERFVRTPCL
jgi:hypothetical protein